jgi:hypothetical protein
MDALRPCKPTGIRFMVTDTQAAGRLGEWPNLDMQAIPQWGTIVVIFVETSVFTRQIRGLITDAEYRKLQQWLIASPDAGDLIRGSRFGHWPRW